MITSASIQQIDPVLGEDLMHVCLYGWCLDANDSLFLQSIPLPLPITEKAFEQMRDDWRLAARPDRWWQVA